MRKNLSKKISLANSKNQTIREATRPNYTLNGSKYIEETNNINNFVSDELSSDFDTYAKKELMSWECLPFSSKKNKNNKIFQKLKKKKNAKTKENKQQNLDQDKNIDNKIAKNEIFRSPKILDSITNIDNNEIQKNHQPYMTSLTNSAFGFGFDLRGGNAENQLTYIVNVQPNGDAASKGLQNGDILVSVQDKNVIGTKRNEIERLLEQYRVEQEIEIVVCRLKDPSHISKLSKKLNQQTDSKNSDYQYFDHDPNLNSTKQLRSLNDQIFNELISLQASFLNDWKKPMLPSHPNSCLSSAPNSNKNEIKNKNMNELDQNFDTIRNLKACDKSKSCLNEVETSNRPFLTTKDFARSKRKSLNPNDVSFVLYDNISGKSNIGSAGNRLSTTLDCSEKNDFIVISLSQQNTQFYHPQFKRTFPNCPHRNMKPLNLNSVKSMSLSINDFTGSILAAERDDYLKRKQTNDHMAWKQFNSNSFDRQNNKSKLLNHSRKNVSYMQTEISNKQRHQRIKFWESESKKNSNQLFGSNLMREKNEKIGTSMIDESSLKQKAPPLPSTNLNFLAPAPNQNNSNLLKNDEPRTFDEFEANFIEIPINIPFLSPNLDYKSMQNGELLQNKHSLATLQSTKSAVYLNNKNEEQFISADFLQLVPPIKQKYTHYIDKSNGSNLELNESTKPNQEQQVMMPKPSRRSIIPYQLSCNDPFISIQQITVHNCESSNSNFAYNSNSFSLPADDTSLVEQNSQSPDTNSDLRIGKIYKDLDETFSSITQDSFENSSTASYNLYASAKNDQCLDEPSASNLSAKNQLQENTSELDDTRENETLPERQIDKEKQILGNNCQKESDGGESLYSLEWIAFKDQNSPTRPENDEDSIDVIQNKRKECIENNDFIKESADEMTFENEGPSSDNQLTEEDIEKILNKRANELKSVEHFYTRSSQGGNKLAYLHNNSFDTSTEIEVSRARTQSNQILNGSGSKLNENQIEFNVIDDLENVLTSSSILASSINDDNEFKNGLNEVIEMSSIDQTKNETNKISTSLPNRITSSLTPSVVFDDGYDSTVSFKHTTNESYSSIDDSEVFQSNSAFTDRKHQKIQIPKENKVKCDIKDWDSIKFVNEPAATGINSSINTSEEIKAQTLDQCLIRNDCYEKKDNCFLENDPKLSFIDTKQDHCTNKLEEVDFQFNETNEQNLTKNCFFVIQDLIKRIESGDKQKSLSLECTSEHFNQMNTKNDENVNYRLLSCNERTETREVTNEQNYNDHSTESTKQIIFDLNSIELLKPYVSRVNFKEPNLSFFILKTFISNYAKQIAKYSESNNNKMPRSIPNSKQFFNTSKLEANESNIELNLTQILKTAENIDYFEIQNYSKPWIKVEDLEQASKIFDIIFLSKIIKNDSSNVSIEIQSQKKDQNERISTNANKKVELPKFSRAIEKDDFDIFSIPPIYCVKKLQNLNSNESYSTSSVDLYRTNQFSKKSENSDFFQTKSLTQNYLWINRKPKITSRTNFGFLNRFTPAIAVMKSMKKFDDSLHFNREKKELQKLNEIFAFYVEKVKILEAQNRTIEIKLEILRKKKQANPFQIEQMFIIELEEAKKVLKDITLKKTKTESWLQKSTDELHSIKLKHQEFEKILNNDRQKIIFLQEQLQSYESEIFSSRRLLKNLKDEEHLLKQNTILLINEINTISNNLKLEINKSLDLEAEKQKLQEEIIILKKEHCEKLVDLKDKLITENCFDPYQFLKDDLVGALHEIRSEFQKNNSEQRNEFERCFYRKKTQIKRVFESDISQNKTMNQQNLKNEIGRSKQNIIKLKADNVLLECKIKGLEDELNNEQLQNTILTNKKEEEIASLKKIFDKFKSDYANELCCKNELEKEIDLFRRLLEDEDKFLKLN